MLASSHQAMKSIFAIFRTLSTSYSSETMLAWKDGKELKAPDPDLYDDAVAFGKDYLAWNLLRKADFRYSGEIDEAALTQAATLQFCEIEDRLKCLNKTRLAPDYLRPGNSQRESVIHTAREKILKVLGDFSPDEMVGLSSFSSGASTRMPRSSGHPVFKYTGKPHVTRGCALLALCAIWHAPVWRSYFQDLHGVNSDPFTWVEIVPGSQYFTVPKTSKSVRGCCKEPDLNMFLQKGIGTMLRRRLKTVGIDLNDQTMNQRLACVGSRTGSLVTIDLEAASDSVSTALVDLLLPADWVRFINLTRSPVVKIQGEWMPLQKISSMGNGFTFELESLIFWALAKASVEVSGCLDRRIGVYGDDIVLHNSAAPLLCDVLDFTGFVVNQGKSWFNGPFRESCGKHYFYGVDVTPFNVKELPVRPADQYHLINRLNLWSSRMGVDCKNTIDYLARTFFPSGWIAVPPHLGTRAGMLVPSVSDAPGLFFSFYSIGRKTNLRIDEQGYSFLALFSVTPKDLRVPDWGRYLTYFQDYSEVRVMASLKEVRYRLRRCVSSEWADCEVGLVQTSG